MTLLRRPAFVGSLTRISDVSASATLTIGAQSETLSNFPVYVNLANLPSSWWSSVSSIDQIRVRNSADGYVPYHVAGVNIVSKTGGLWFKGTLSSTQSTVFKVVVTLDTAANPASGTYGSNTVWSDYARVYICDPSRRDWTDVDNAARGLLDSGTTSDVTTSDGGFGIRFIPVHPYSLKAGTQLTQNSKIFTMGVTGAINVNAGWNNAVMSWTNGTSRVTFVFPDGVGGRPIGVWDVQTSWLYSGVSEALNTPYRLNTVYNNAARSFYVNGANKVSGGSAWVAPFVASDLYLGMENASGGEMMNGTVGMAYLRMSVLSDAWIAAEFLNLRTPLSFYSIS